MNMPSEKRYLDLLDALRQSLCEFDSAHKSHVKRRASILRGLHAVIRYLHANGDVINEGLTRPLSALSREVEAIVKGAGSNLLRSPAQHGSSPPRAWLQAYLALASELLITSKMGELEAAKWVAAEAKRQGVCDETGDTITANQIKGWRKDIKRDKGPKGAREFFDDLRQDYNGMLRGPSNEGEREINLRVAKAVAGSLIRSVGLNLPLSAPKARGRKD